MVETALAIAGSTAGVVLINKISDAVGWYVAPRQIVRTALAESKADLIRAKSKVEIADIEAADLIQRAEFRSAVEQIVQQANLESIISKALLKLDVCADPQDMERDWICNFLDRCRNVSDEEMQDLWANILAGECQRGRLIFSENGQHHGRYRCPICQAVLSVLPLHSKDWEYRCPLTILDNDNEISDIYASQGVDYQFLRGCFRSFGIILYYAHYAQTLSQ